MLFNCQQRGFIAGGFGDHGVAADALQDGADVMLEEISVDGIAEPIRFWMSGEQFEYWKHTHLTIDVVPGRGSGFSLETTENMRFITRSRVYTDAEWEQLKDPKVPTGLDLNA
ncbi:MAG: DUF779 domain-containing protein [Aquiluna sp.]